MQVADMFQVRGKRVLVTGGGSGIGRMIAEGFLAQGCEVFVSSRKMTAETARKIQGRLPGRCHGIAADVTDEASVERLMEQIGEAGLHVLVNNSGTNYAEGVDSYPAAAFRKVLDVNVTGVFLCTQKALPLLEATATAEDPARVINIGSIAGQLNNVSAVEYYAYSASKAAVHEMSQALAGFLGDRHITVNCIAPGPFQSRMMKVTLETHGEAIREGTVLDRIGRPEDVAGTAIWLASPAGSFVTGAIVVVDGGTLIKPRL